MTLEGGRLSGTIHLETKAGDRGYRGKLLGFVKAESGKVTRFDVVVLGDYWGEGTFTRGASVGREAGRWPGLAAYAAVARCVKRRPTGVSRPSTDRRPAGRGRSDGARMQRSWCVLATQTERSGQIVVGTKGTPAGYRCRNC